MSKDNIIELINITKEYDGNTIAVDDISLTVKKGEFVTLLGPSGCGKTTTLRMIAGFELPTKGRILLNGQDITNFPPHLRPVNTVFQRYALFPHLNVFNNIAFGLKLKKVVTYETDNKGNTYEVTTKLTKEQIEAKVNEALRVVDLEDYGKRDVSTLSGGQQQRVAIARAIVNEPQILLLDEPLGALDLKKRKEMQLELKEMHRKLGITFIYVTHDQEEALTMSDTIVVMKDGTIQQIGTPKGIYDEPINSYVADFIGESNIYSATIVSDRRVRFANNTFDCVDTGYSVNQKVDAVVRPEDIVISDPETSMLTGTVVSSVFKGIHYEMTVMVGRNEFLIQAVTESKQGSKVGLNIAPDSIHIMNKDFTVNTYVGYITKHNKVVFAEAEFDCDVTQLYPNSKLTDDNTLIDEKGNEIDLTDVDVNVQVSLKDIEISDDLDDCNISGKIVSNIYKGDHYQMIIRTEEEDDFVVDTEYSYNEQDQVGIKIKPSLIKLTLKTEVKK